MHQDSIIEYRDEIVKVSPNPESVALYHVWQSHPSLANALRTLDHIEVGGSVDLYVGPLKQIMNSPEASKPSRQLAHDIFHKKRSILDWNNNLVEYNIKALKNLIQESPRSPLFYIEKARNHYLLGQDSSAKADLQVALGLAPYSRQILRPFTRFAAHHSEDLMEEALHRLRHAPTLRFDPWLMSAEISLSSRLGVAPEMTGAARKMADSREISARSLTELRAAVGTFDLVDKQKRKGKRYLRSSIVGANGNSISQYAWAYQNGLIIPDEDGIVENFSRDHEASFYLAVREKRWNDALSCLKEWRSFEPTSNYIASTGSYIASSICGNYTAGLEFCEHYLQYYPDDKGILNNKVVALCHLGRVEEAKPLFIRSQYHSDIQRENIISMATAGLIHYRAGNPELGGEMYKKSVDSAIKQKQKMQAVRASIHWLYEETRACGVMLSYLNETLDKIDKKINKLVSVKGDNDFIIDIWNAYKERMLDGATYTERGRPSKQIQNLSNLIQSLD
ncbi:tetratricopeptide repeat protein [Glycocaulis abyssi]|uniref:Tetratricopeptide repeat protein n=1 Tax=Glycocaulis abyssi TaxID=1433403 RepID=A0ABV9NAC1_9PROT